MTKYKVLFKPAPEEGTSNAAVSAALSAGFQVLEGHYEAVRTADACRAAAEKTGDAGEYAAVPMRSWEPITIEIERTPRAKVVK